MTMLSLGADAEKFPNKLVGEASGGAVFADLRNAILRGELEHGQKIASLRELALQYGISPNAVRAAISRLERLRLVSRRRGSGTFVLSPSVVDCNGQRLPSEQPRFRPKMDGISWSQAVALFIPSREHLFDRLASSIAGRCQRAGMIPVKLDWTGDLRRDGLQPMFEQWNKQPPAAVVIHYDDSQGKLDQVIASVCRGRSRIITTFRDPFKVYPTHHVGPDYPGAGLVAAEYLLQQGRQRIGFMTSIRPSLCMGRYYLYQRVKMRAIGQFLRDRSRIRGFRVHRHLGNLMSDVSIDAMTRWLSRPDRPDALIGDDFRIVGLLRAAHRARIRVPEDLAVVGIGDTPWSHTFRFPSVSYREEDVAAHIARVIIDPLPDGEMPLYQLTVPARIVLRDNQTITSVSSELFHHLELPHRFPETDDQ
ncbi:MAG: GntR family transcriptional regulator [Phycisphaeraceae bacterium]|nr:GntR family transcriptional regulator [Phycisphaeraceae bacterium]